MNKVNIFNKIKNLYKKLSTLGFLKYFFYEENNIIVSENEIEEFNNLCGKIEGNYLDNEQISSILSKNDNTLIIAGAGSGKTTTIIGKIKYLIKTNQCEPEDILLLSFTNTSAKEMKLRVKKETNMEIDTYTFHKLGLEIIKSTQNTDVNIFTGEVSNLIIKFINELFNDTSYLLKFVNYIINDICGYTNTTIDNKIINKKHIDIYNYLYLNKIKFTYKNIFFLPKYNKYINSYSDLLNLINKEKILTNISTNLIWYHLCNFNKNIYMIIANSFETIISLIKSNNYTINEVNNLITNKTKIIFDLIKPIYIKYNNYLSKNNLIDFNDMINKSTDLIKTNKYIHHYKYVIVDEYQDISMSRYKLLLAMRNQNYYKLFCVGDDWQSIYRFSGSDISLITNFSKYWGPTSISRIQHTYRFSSTLANISGKFIMHNPNQLKKNIIGFNSNTYPIEIINGLNELETKLKELPYYSKIYLLGRYTFDIDILRKCNNFTLEYNRYTKDTDIIYNKRIDLDIKFLTAHKSKGLQSDYVVILNNKDELMGFPSKVKDSNLVNSLLDNSDTYPFSEERRLFYVALTRCKKKVYLLTESNNKSIFIKYLEKNKR